MSSPRSRETAGAYAALDAAYRAGNPGRQAEAAARLAARQTWRVDLWETSARFALAAGEDQRAVDYFLKAQARGALSPQGQFTLGKTYVRLGSEKQAEAIWKDLPGHPGAVQSLAELYTRRGDYPAAVKYWKDYLALLDEPLPGSVEEEIGLVLAAHQPLEALDHLEAAAPASDRAARLADVLWEVREEDQAYQLLRSGQTLAALGEWRLAEYAMRRAVDLRTDYPEAWAYWGEALQHVETPDQDPERALNKALDLAPESPLVHMFYGLYLQRVDQHLQALEHFRAAEQGWSDHPEVYYEQGQSLAVLGDLEGAVERYQEAVEAFPENARVYQRLAEFTLEFHYRIQDLGLPAARRAAALAPGDPATLVTLGRIFLALEDSTSAVRVLYRALEIEPDAAAAHLALGVVFLEEGRPERAEMHLRQVLAAAESPAVRDRAKSLLSLTEQ